MDGRKEIPMGRVRKSHTDQGPCNAGTSKKLYIDCTAPQGFVLRAQTVQGPAFNKCGQERRLERRTTFHI